MAYSDADMLRMQQDAIRRVHEMHRRAAHAVQSGGQVSVPTGGQGQSARRQSVQNPFQRPISPPVPISEQEHRNTLQQPSTPFSGIKGILDSLKGSSDTILILALLLVLLNNEEQDMLLILALLYLLL